MYWQCMLKSLLLIRFTTKKVWWPLLYSCCYGLLGNTVTPNYFTRISKNTSQMLSLVISTFIINLSPTKTATKRTASWLSKTQNNHPSIHWKFYNEQHIEHHIASLQNGKGNEEAGNMASGSTRYHNSGFQKNMVQTAAQRKLNGIQIGRKTPMCQIKDLVWYNLNDIISR